MFGKKNKNQKKQWIIRCNAARVATRIRQGYDFIDSVEEIIGTEVKA